MASLAVKLQALRLLTDYANRLVPAAGNSRDSAITSAFDALVTAITTGVEPPSANSGAVPSNPPTPTFPPTGITVTNTHPYAVNVSITGGTVTHIKVNGTSTGLTSGNFVVPSGGTVAVTYTATPTWVWTNADGRATTAFTLAVDTALASIEAHTSAIALGRAITALGGALTQ